VLIYRVRRKKCDEEKPTCRRCREAQVKCDGYTQTPSQKKNPLAVKRIIQDSGATDCTVARRQTRSIPPDIGSGFGFFGSARDRLFFYHFCSITIVDFVRLATPKDFWSLRVLPMSHDEPAVRHAVVALGAAHQLYLQKLSAPFLGDTNASMASLEVIATQHYNKAIGDLVKMKTTTTPTTCDAQVTILTCCLLFVCLENLLGRFDEGIRHMQAGARLLETCNPSAAPHDSKQLMQEIATVLLRFGVDASMLTEDDVISDMTPYAAPLMEIDEELAPFSSLAECKDAIWDLEVRLFNNPCDCGDGVDGTATDRGVSSEMIELAASFERWKFKFDLLVSSLPDSQALKMEIQREILVLMLRRCAMEMILLPETADNDEELSKLNHELIEMAEHLYSMEASWLGRPMFTLDSDTIPSLFFVATFCEDPALVQRIVALLRGSRRREGPWDSWEAAKKLEQGPQKPFSVAT
jgi:hypothetical protein